MDEEQRKQASMRARSAAARRKLNKQVEKIKVETRFHRWAAEHHEHKAWEVEADLIKLAVEVYNEANLFDVGTERADYLTARLSSWKCPPDEEEHKWMKENHTDEEWEKYLAKVALNPLGICVYDDPNNDYCLFCGLPNERK